MNKEKLRGERLPWPSHLESALLGLRAQMSGFPHTIFDTPGS
jgi:hypothetical protein